VTAAVLIFGLTCLAIAVGRSLSLLLAERALGLV